MARIKNTIILLFSYLSISLGHICFYVYKNDEEINNYTIIEYIY